VWQVSAARLAPGDRVIRTSWPAGEVGTVVKPSPKTVLVRFDRKDKDERVDRDSIRPETVEDVRKREHARRMKEWEDVQPKHGIVSIERDRSWYGTHKVIGFEVHATTPAEMRAAADELRALADWFEQRPTDPTP